MLCWFLILLSFRIVNCTDGKKKRLLLYQHILHSIEREYNYITCTKAYYFIFNNKKESFKEPRAKNIQGSV